MRHRLLLLVFFVSGATALVYEILWEKKLELIFGTTVEGLTAILSVFFAGLAIGSFIFGKVSDRLNVKKLLIAYGLVEVGIGLLSFGSPFFFEALGQASLFFMLFPVTLIGATFPLVTRYFSTQETLKDKVSLLYAINTLGAVLGVLVATFWLIRTFGVNGGIWLAAGVNVVLGGLVLLLASNVEGIVFKVKKKISLSRREPQGGLLLPVFFLTGMLALALEVFWTKALVLVFGGSLYSFAVILVAFLLGIVLGSFFARFLDKRRSWFWFGIFQGLIAIWVLASLPLFNKLPGFFVSLFEKGGFSQLIWVSFLISTMVILPATFFSGASFPLAVELYRGKFKRLGEGVGRVYAANTLGAVLGPLVAYFLLLPFLGIQRSIIAIGISYGLLGVFFLFKQKKLPIILLAALLVLFVVNISFSSWNKQELTAGRYLYPDFSVLGSELLFYEEGKNTTVTVRKTATGDTVLQVNGKADASAISDLDTELLLGHLPLLFSRNPEKVLVIGFGSGITAGAVSTYPVGEIDIVEIEKAVIDAGEYFAEYNHDILSDKRVGVTLDDARTYLLNTDKTYDVITSEPSNPWIAGVGNLFSKEFYELAKENLSEDGVMFQWIHTYGMSEENLKIAIRTFAEVFPEVTLWTNWLGQDIFLMGSGKPLEIADDVSDSARNDLVRIHASPEQIFDFLYSRRRSSSRPA